MAIEYGYAGKIIKVDLSSGHITLLPTEDYAERFLGGRGIAAKVYWDEVSPDVKALDPENRLIFMTGPLAGFSGLAGSRWQVCGKSPATAPEQFCYSNFGGSWGARLKFAGYDGIVVEGRAEKPVYLFIQDNLAEIRDASDLWGRSTVEVREILKGDLGSSVRVVACGPAGENLVSFASLLADEDSSGSSGFGAVMGSERLKAIVVKGSGKVRAADPERLRQLTKYLREVNAAAERPHYGTVERGPKMRKVACYGCISGCIREVFEASDGKKGKFMCHGAMFYQDRARRYYGQWTEVPFYANRICDEYGLDIWAVDAIIAWLSSCHKKGMLADEDTGIPISKIGSLEFIETLVKKISLREGFGDILARGIVEAAHTLGGGPKEILARFPIVAGQLAAYDPREYITPALFYAVEPRVPIQQLHMLSFLLPSWVKWVDKVEGVYLSSNVFRAIGRMFFGGESAVDFSTYDGKALAAKKIQDRMYALESLILCDFAWPITSMRHSDDHVGDPTMESKVLSAVIGREVDEEWLNRMGGRIFNLQRAILAREGHGGRESDRIPEPFYTVPSKGFFLNPELIAPGRGGEVISLKGAVVEREGFERMKDEYYGFRGWDVATGLQTRAKLEEMGLGDIADDLEQRGLIV